MFARLRYCGTGFKLAVRVRVFSKSSVGQLAEPLNSAQDVLNFWFGHNYLTPSGTNELIVANTVCHIPCPRCTALRKMNTKFPIFQSSV